MHASTPVPQPRGSHTGNRSTGQQIVTPGSGATQTPPPSYRSDSDGSVSLDNNEKTNRFSQKTKYLMMKKKIMVPFTALVTILCVAYVTKPSVEFIELIKMHNGVNALTILGGVMLASLVFFGMWALIQSFRTEEHKVRERELNKVLGEVLEKLPSTDLIKYIMLEQSNGKRFYFGFHTLNAQVNDDHCVKGGKIVTGHFTSDWLNAISNRRALVPALLTALIFGNITFPLVHAMSSGFNLQAVCAAYANPYSVIAISSVLIVTTMVFIVRNISRTDFEKVLYLHKEEKVDPKSAGKTLIDFITRELSKENPNLEAAQTSAEQKLSIPDSRITQISAEFANRAEMIFCIN